MRTATVIDHDLSEARDSIAKHLGLNPIDVAVAINEHDEIIYISTNTARTTYSLNKMRNATFKSIPYAEIAADLQRQGRGEG